MATVAVGCGSNSSQTGGPVEAGVGPDVMMPQETPSMLQEAGAVEAPVSPSSYCGATAATGSSSDLSGIWAIRMVGAQNVQAPIVGILHIKSTFTALVQVRQSGSQVTLDGHYCDRGEIDPPGASQVSIPDAWAHTEKAIHRTGTYAAGSGSVAVLTLPADEAAGGVEVAGAVLASPASDDLPTSSDDPRVIDEDHDGNPGITVQLSGMSIHGSIFSVQRQSTSVSASPVAAGKLVGTLAFISTQNVLGSNPPTIADLYRLSKQSPDLDPQNSSFVMVKIGDVSPGGLDGGEIDGGIVMPACSEIRAAEACLFPDTP